MITPILNTKINIPPPRSDLVPRARLIDMLDEADSHRLILISAPAGFGKTTLMSSWVADSRLPAAWLSLDAEDNNLTRFLTYFATALRSFAAEAGRTTLAMLHSTQPAPTKTVLTALINELSSIPDDCYLFLDDYHLINDQEVHSAFAYLVEHSPPSMHVVLASRSDPPLPLSRLRARGQLLEIRQSDLRFTPAEAATFLNQGVGLDLTVQQIASLEARTEGWIAGLQLAALSMRGSADREAFVQAFSGSHRFVIDYLADEVYSQQPEDLRQFLLKTCILDRFTASLCHAVTGREDSVELLRVLEDSNLFLIPLDDRREWYRYHHLFSDFLRTRLDEHSSVELHKNASQWFMSQGLLPEAVRHALATGDTVIAERVISQAAVEAINLADFQTLLGWMDALPEQTVRDNPVLASSMGIVLFMTSTYEHALPYAIAAENSISPDAPLFIQGQLLCLKAHLALCDDQLDECINFARDALEYLDEEHLFLRSLTLNVLGQVLEMKGDVAAAAGIYRQAFETGWQAGDRLGALVVFTNLIFALNELGRRREAVAWCEQVIGDGEAGSAQSLPLLDAVYLPWSLLAYEANDLELARRYAQRALEFLTAVKFPLGIIWGQYILARIDLAEGEYDLAKEISRKGYRLAARMGRGDVQGDWFAALEAQADLDRGELPAALNWAESGAFTPQDSPHIWFDHSYFTYTRTLLAQGRFGDAQKLLDTMEALAQDGGRKRKLISIHLLHALALSAQEDKQESVSRLARALRLAAPQDYRRAFLEEGQKIAQLLPLARSAAPLFVDDLLLAFRPAYTPLRQVEGLLDPLTEREGEVLNLVAKGLSNREIADVLVVTLGTVKKHLNNIFSKLYVSNRTQAVARAREIGLLE